MYLFFFLFDCSVCQEFLNFLFSLYVKMDIDTATNLKRDFKESNWVFLFGIYF